MLERRFTKRFPTVALGGRWILLVAMTTSLVQLPLPVVHAHDTRELDRSSSDSLGEAWLYGHLQRMHLREGRRQDAIESHWHLVLPSQLSRELGGETPELPLEPPGELDAIAGSLGGPLSLARPIAVVLLPAKMPAAGERASCLRSCDESSQEFIGSYLSAVRLCALIGVCQQ